MILGFVLIRDWSVWWVKHLELGNFPLSGIWKKSNFVQGEIGFDPRLQEECVFSAFGLEKGAAQAKQQ